MPRYVLNATKSDIENIFGAQAISNSIFGANFNTLPCNSMPIIINEAGKRLVKSAYWGIPNPDSKKKEVISELDLNQISILGNPTDLYNTQSCIIPINGFYIWKKAIDNALPFYVRLLSRKILGVAGIYSKQHTQNGSGVYSYAMLLTPANVLLKPMVDTMPCILHPKDFEKWLTGGAFTLAHSGFNDISLLPDMAVYRVPDLVNNPANNSPELIQPIPKLREED